MYSPRDISGVVSLVFNWKLQKVSLESCLVLGKIGLSFCIRSRTLQESGHGFFFPPPENPSIRSPMPPPQTGTLAQTFPPPRCHFNMDFPHHALKLAHSSSHILHLQLFIQGLGHLYWIHFLF